MKTINLASQKGASGKTTLVSHLAVETERAGDGPAWMIDTDRQATLSQWHERREARTAPAGRRALFANWAQGWTRWPVRGRHDGRAHSPRAGRQESRRSGSCRAVQMREIMF